MREKGQSEDQARQHEAIRLRPIQCGRPECQAGIEQRLRKESWKEPRRVGSAGPCRRTAWKEEKGARGGERRPDADEHACAEKECDRCERIEPRASLHVGDRYVPSGHRGDESNDGGNQRAVPGGVALIERIGKRRAAVANRLSDGNVAKTIDICTATSDRGPRQCQQRRPPSRVR